ncbi:MAG: ABC transporter permease [Clostridia bacterium]|nr:ABC transporter permease [Clostridia bacterium]
MKALKRLYVAVIYILLYAPIAILILYSFNENSNRSKFTGFSLRWYKELFSDSEILSALIYTLLCAVLASLIATVIGTITAVGINKMRRGPKNTLMNLAHIPMLNPEIVTGVSLMLLFVFINLERGFSTMLLAHITFNIPYVIISVLPKLRQMNPHLYEAALDLGAHPLYAFMNVVMPEIKSGIITGFLFSMTMSIDDFVISFFTTGNGVQNLSIYIYNAAKRGISPKVNALSALMFAVMLVLLLIVNSRDDSKKEPIKK